MSKTKYKVKGEDSVGPFIRHADSPEAVDKIIECVETGDGVLLEVEVQVCTRLYIGDWKKQRQVAEQAGQHRNG